MYLGPFLDARAAVDSAHNDRHVKVYSTFSTIVAVYLQSNVRQPEELYELKMNRSTFEWWWKPMLLQERV